MSAIDKLFTNLRREKRKALMPFITAGDPDLDFTAAVFKEVVARGRHSDGACPRQTERPRHPRMSLRSRRQRRDGDRATNWNFEGVIPHSL
jgi:hypothetical protein